MLIQFTIEQGTKYFGGHSDLLCGILIAKSKPQWDQVRLRSAWLHLTIMHVSKLWSDRTFMGTVMGSLEAWLLLRSLRTLHLRVPRQSESATILAKWLHQIASTKTGEYFDGVQGGLVKQVWHSSLQTVDSFGWEPSKQMEGGWNATFSMLVS